MIDFMNKHLTSTIKKHKSLWLFCLVYLGIFFLKLDSIPMIAMDEGWNAFYAYDMFGSNTYDLSSTIQYQLFFLYYFFLSIWMKWFGISLITVRSLAVVIGLVGLIGFYKCLTRLTTHKGIVMFGMTVFAMTNIVVVTFRWGRPEGMVLVLLIWALFFLIKAIQLNNETQLIGVGLFMGLMVITHPYSGIMIIAFLAMAWRLPLKPIRAYRSFILGGGIIAFFILMKGIIWDLEYVKTYFFNHISERLIVANSEKSILENVNYFLVSYTLGIKRLYIFLFELGVLLLGITRYRKQSLISNLSWLGLLTLIVGLMFISPFRRRYMGIVMILSILVSLLIGIHSQKKLKSILVTALIVYFLNNMAGNIVYVAKQRHNIAYSEVTTKLQAVIPNDATIIAPIQFWIALHPFYVVTDIHDQLRNDELDNQLANSDFIVTSPYFVRNVSPTTGGEAIGYNSSENVFYKSLNTAIQEKQWLKLLEFEAKPYDIIGVYEQSKKGEHD